MATREIRRLDLDNPNTWPLIELWKHWGYVTHDELDGALRHSGGASTERIARAKTVLSDMGIALVESIELKGLDEFSLRKLLRLLVSIAQDHAPSCEN
jgi:hypothetical protein